MMLVVAAVVGMLMLIWTVLHASVKVETALKELSTEGPVPDGEEKEPEFRMEVSLYLNPQGLLLIRDIDAEATTDEKPLLPGEAVERLRKRFEPGQVTVTLICHEKAKPGMATNVLDELAKRGYDKITFMVGEEEF